MATRAIVTSQPVVACDVCGRRLLRGETPDVFLAAGQRRTVCELCVPRASAEGWMREADDHDLSVRPPRARRAGSLFGRLRQLREPERRPQRRDTGAARLRPGLDREGEEDARHGAEDSHYDFLDDGSVAASESYERAAYIGSAASESAALDPRAEPSSYADSQSADLPATSGELKVGRALEVFNASDTTQRVAGVARSLGAPTVVVRALEESGATVAIVVAWELCWYRYEIDLGDEAMGPRLVAEGMELDQLPEQDRVANAAADERGELSLSRA
jgi:hypothetical protein